MEENLRLARTLVLKYSEFLQARDIDAILDVLSEEATLQVPDTPLLESTTDIRQFYENRLTAEDYLIQIEITDEKAVSDLCFINGLMTLTISREGVSNDSTVLNFSFILKKEAGQLKIWQIRMV